MQNTNGHSEAHKVREKNQSQRAKRLEKLESYVRGTQYAGLPDWFSETKPLWERAPCIVCPITKNAIDSNVDLLLAEGRFPLATVEGMSGADAGEFEKANASVMKQSRLHSAARETFGTAQGCGSACVVFGVRGGQLFSETVRASWCTPELNWDGSVKRLEIRYPYVTTIRISAVEEKAVCKIYRRVIDAISDVRYHPANANEDGTEPDWRVDEEVKHNLGRCPVVWYAHMHGCAIHEDVDGHAIHEHLTDEIRAHDFALSQRHRAALYAGDPQWTECGVAAGYNPAGGGNTRKVEMPASTFGRPGETPHAAYVSGGAGGKARKKSPGTVWQYESAETKVTLHTLPGDALKALDDHARDLRLKLSEGLGVVFLDLESMPNESRLSGKALEAIKGRQLDRVDNYRLDFGDKFLLPALGMLLHIAITSGVKVDGLDAVKKHVATVPNWSWHAPRINLMWGKYFRPTGEEEELIVRATTTARQAGLLTDRLAVERLRDVYNIKDIDAYMKELAEHQAKVQTESMKMAEHEASLKPKPAPPAGK